MTTATRQQTVLIVEDNPDITDILEEALAAPGRNVRCEDSVSQALEAIHEQTPDLILLDLFLPDASGMEVLRELSHQEQYRGVPVFIISGCNSLTTKLNGFLSGARRFFAKPVDLDNLIECVEKTLARCA